MLKIFISHSMDARDQRLLNYLEKRILNYGFTTYFAEREIATTQNINDAIKSLIKKSDIILVYLSSSAVNSAFIHHEIKCAQELQKPILIIKERGIFLPENLKNISAIEFDPQNSEAFSSAFNSWLLSTYTEKLSKSIGELKSNEQAVLGLVALGLLVGLVFLASKK